MAQTKTHSCTCTLCGQPITLVPSPVRHCVYIVLGNEGWDAIADHSVAREPGDTWDTVTEAHDAWLDKEYP